MILMHILCTEINYAQFLNCKQVCDMVTSWQFNTTFNHSVWEAFSDDKIQVADEPLTSVTSFNLCLGLFECVYDKE